MAIGVWGSNGQLVTPDEIDQRRQLAQSLMQQSQQPANYWTQGVANMMNAFLGGFENGRANKEQAGMADKSAKFMQSLYPDSAQALPQQPIAQTQSPSVAQALVSTQAPDYGTTSASPVAHTLGQNMAVDDFTNRLAQAESGGNPNAANPASSARGLYQITASTQAGIARNHPEANLPATGPMTPDQQKIAAILLDQDNRNALSAQGIQPNDANAYGAWFLGAPTATKVLSASDITPVSSLTGDAAVRANPFLKNMTVGDFRDWTAGKIGAPTSAITQSPPPAAQPQPSAQPSALLAQPAQQSGPSLGQLMQGMMDPTLSPQAHAMAAMIFQTRMQQDHEARQRQDEQQQWLQRQDYSNTQDQKNWQERQQYLTQQQASDPLRQAQIAAANARTQYLLRPTQQPRSFQTVTGAQAQSLNLDPNQTWQVGADGSTKSLGKSPEAAAQAQKATQANTASAIASVDAAANNALALLKDHPGSTTGTLGHYAASWLPGSNAAQLRDQINTIKSNGSYAALSALKAQGVSMGSMSDADMRLASEKAGAINPDAPPAVVRQQINDYRATVNRLYQGSSSASNAPAAQQAATSTGTQPQYRAGQRARLADGSIVTFNGTSWVRGN